MKASEFINKLQNIVDNYKTLYVMGCFGAPLTGANVSRYCTNHRYNKQAARTAMIRAAADKNPPSTGSTAYALSKAFFGVGAETPRSHTAARPMLPTAFQILGPTP